MACIINDFEIWEFITGQKIKQPIVVNDAIHSVALVYSNPIRVGLPVNQFKETLAP